MKVLFIAGMIERKFYSKIEPILELPNIEKVFVVRRDKIEDDRITCYSPTGLFKKNFILSELYRFFSIIYIIIKFKPSYIISAGLILHGIYGNLIGKLLNVKRILLLMGQYELPLNYPAKGFKQKILIKIAFTANIIGVRGNNSASLLKKHGFRNKTFIPSNVFSFNDFYPIEEEKENDLVYIGNLNQEKRIDLLIDVANILVNKHGYKDLGIKIIGNGPKRSALIEKVNNLNLISYFQFIPFMEKKELVGELNKSKVLVLTSEAEGLPMVIVEAFSCAIPAVSFDIADISDLAVHEKNALLYKFGDIEGFAGGIHKLLSDSILYEKMSKEAYLIKKQKESEFSLSNQREIWSQILK